MVFEGAVAQPDPGSLKRFSVELTDWSCVRSGQVAIAGVCSTRPVRAAGAASVPAPAGQNSAYNEATQPGNEPQENLADLKDRLVRLEAKIDQLLPPSG